ncbi:acyltransferase family protein [Saccharopolyspora sp. MS10]|uniref:acyltransferase family protein n=1 Tax=Saccharopolyspora sp. MS10 TaxID=3385973 RepID=UPI0039A33DAB
MGTLRVDHAHPERFADPAHGFAWIRMFGALLVIYGHSSPLVGTGELFPPHWALQPDEGVLMGFFAMSGFQITESWLRDPHPARFAVKRVLRLWPPMLTVTLGMALVIGPLVTALPAGEYFAARETWGYVINNAGLLGLQHELPGVFSGNPWPDAVNGSLWTLPMELLAYAGLYVLLLLGAAKQRWRWLSVAALVVLVVWDRHLEQLPGAESAGSLLSVPVESLVAFLVAFAFGVVLNLYRIPLSVTAAVAGAVVLVAMPNSIAASFLMVFVASYAVVVAGHFWPARLTVPGLWVNGSYGVYVWGFPVQQLLAMAGIANQYVMLLCAAPIAYLLGTASWVFIEEPTMKLRHLVAPSSPPRPLQRDEGPRGRDEGAEDEWDQDWEGEEPDPDWDADEWEPADAAATTRRAMPAVPASAAETERNFPPAVPIRAERPRPPAPPRPESPRPESPRPEPRRFEPHRAEPRRPEAPRPPRRDEPARGPRFNGHAPPPEPRPDSSPRGFSGDLGPLPGDPPGPEARTETGLGAPPGPGRPRGRRAAPPPEPPAPAEETRPLGRPSRSADPR